MDERLSLPSASSRARDSRCPGALNIINALRLAGLLREEVHPWTESGTKIHAASTGEEVELDHAETSALETVEARLDKLKKLLGVPGRAEEIVERRFWMRDGLRKIASGKPDRIWRFDDTSVIPDIKTGWGETEAEESNLQFRAYAVLERLNRPEVDQVIVATINAHGKPPKPVVYDRAALLEAEQEWRSEIRACMAPGAPRVAGPIQCKYCPAKLHCQQAQAVLKETSSLTIHETGLTVTNEELAALLDRCGLAEKMIGTIRAEARRRLETGLEVPGWQLAPGRSTTPITDIQSVFSKCAEMGIQPEAFTAVCSITKKALTDLLKNATGQKGKALDTIIAQVTAGATESKQSAPTLKRRTAE